MVTVTMYLLYLFTIIYFCSSSATWSQCHCSIARCWISVEVRISLHPFYFWGRIYNWSWYGFCEMKCNKAVFVFWSKITATTFWMDKSAVNVTSSNYLYSYRTCLHYYGYIIQPHRSSKCSPLAKHTASNTKMFNHMTSITIFSH